MASVLQRGKKRAWYAVFRDLSGKQRWVALKDVPTGDSREARRQAQKTADLLELTAQRRKSAQAVRQAFTDLYREFYGENLPVSNVQDFAAKWLNQCEAELAASSFMAYKTTVDRFLAFLGPRAEADLADLSRADIVAFRNDLARTLASNTVGRYLKITRMLFRVAHRDGYVMVNPAEHVPAVRNEARRRRRSFTVPELQAVLAVADPEWASLVRFGLYTGQRLGDLALLTWQNIDLERREFRLVTQKTGRTLVIPLAPPLFRLLEESPPDDPGTPVHPRAFAVMAKQRRVVTLSNRFSELLVQAGLRTKVTHQSRGIGRSARRASSELTFHSLRHTAVSLLKDAGIPQATVMELVGHESVAMSAHYTHTGWDSLQKAAASLPTL